MASLEEIKRSIEKLRGKADVFEDFCRKYPKWGSWKRAPYKIQRADVEKFLVEHRVLERSLLSSDVRGKLLNFPIKVPNLSSSTLTGTEFRRAFPENFFLFRRAGRAYKHTSPILVSRIQISASEPYNFTETRAGQNRTNSFKLSGTAYLSHGSLVLLAVDEIGHPSLASFAHVHPEKITTSTPILDGHLLASTREPPNNANFVVKVMLVHSIQTEAATGVFTEDREALAEFEKQRPATWSEERWRTAFNDRFDAGAPPRWDGNYYENFASHQKFDM